MQSQSANGAGASAPVRGDTGTGKHQASDAKPSPRARGPPPSTRGTVVRQASAMSADSPAASARGRRREATGPSPGETAASFTVQAVISMRPPASTG